MCSREQGTVFLWSHKSLEMRPIAQGFDLAVYVIHSTSVTAQHGSWNLQRSADVVLFTSLCNLLSIMALRVPGRQEGTGGLKAPQTHRCDGVLSARCSVLCWVYPHIQSLPLCWSICSHGVTESFCLEKTS